MVKGKLYTYKQHWGSIAALVAAKYGGAQLEQVNVTADKDLAGVAGLPALECEAEKVQLVGPHAVAYYLVPEEMRGKTPADRALLQQWLWFAESDLAPAVCSLVYPHLKVAGAHAAPGAHAHLQAVLARLNKHLESHTFLVGERLSLADLVVAASALPLFEYVLDATARAQTQNVTRWYRTVTGQKNWRDAVGEPVLCEKACVGAAAAGGHGHSAHGHSAHGHDGKKDKKEEKKEKKEEKKKEEPKKEAKKEEPKKKKDEDDGDDEEKEEKRADPFATMPKSEKLVMDDWKRTYSNQDREKVAMPWFWEHWDPACYSIWLCEYQFPAELKRVFMTSNLINGMHQRLEKMMRNSFAVMGIYGEDNNNTIVGVWLMRGQELSFKLDADWQTDYESYNWRKLDLTSAADKSLVENVWTMHEAFMYGGRKFNQGKILR